jgi:3-methyladenine DNA glycosylase Tag
MGSYCEYLRDHPEDTLNKNYHDSEYGFPLTEDAALLERLALEINQAGLSTWPSKASRWTKWLPMASRRWPAS